MSGGHRVVIYYQMQYDTHKPPNSPYGHYISPLPLVKHATHLLVAAIWMHQEPPRVLLNDYKFADPRFDQMWKDIATMQSKGVKVMGMLGGWGSRAFEWLTDDFDTYYTPLAGYIKQYKLDGLDLDCEVPADVSVMVRLISQLKADFGPDFIVTLSPVASALSGGNNLSGFSYQELEQKVGSKISWYNAQFYSGFGSFASDSQYLDILNFGKGLDPSRLVAGSLSNQMNGHGYVNPHEVASTAKTLCAKFGPKFGGVAAWEYYNCEPDPSEPWKWAEKMRTAMAQGEAESKRG